MPLKILCSSWSLKIIRINSEAAAVTAINKVLPNSVITGCKFSPYTVPLETNIKYCSCGGMKRN